MFKVTNKTDVEIFYDSSTRNIKNEIKNFIVDNPDIKIFKILQSESQSEDDYNLTITIFYEKK